MSRRMFLVLSLLAVLSLAVMGIAYTAWMDTLEINGTVHTGVLDAHMVLGNDTDQGYNADPYVNNDADNDSQSGVATCVASLDNGPIGGDVDNGPDGLLITVGNAYPGYNCAVEFGVLNAGSIPINVGSPVVDNVQGTYPPVAVSAAECWQTPIQLAAGASSRSTYARCRVTIDVQDGALESTTYQFIGRFDAWQFNQ